jgi:hypothetical protein
MPMSSWSRRREPVETHMDRFFFHVRHRDELIDRDGIVLADVATAKAQLVISSGELLRDLGGGFCYGGPLRAWVTDEAGETICALRIEWG